MMNVLEQSVFQQKEVNYCLLIHLHCTNINIPGDGHCFARYFSKQFKPNKAGLFEGSFFWREGVNLTLLDISGKTDLISI